MVFKNFRRFKADIICLQETYCTDENQRFWASEWGARSFFSNGQSNSKGVAILFRKGFSGKVIHSDIDENGRFIILTVKLYGKELVISNVYAPNEDRPEFFQIVLKHLQNANSPEWLIGGDFNLTLGVMDRKSVSQDITVKKAAIVLKEIMQECDLVDVWRDLNPDTLRFLCHKSSKVASRIDFFLISYSLLSSVEKVDIIPSATSDHSVLFIELKLDGEPSGRG